MKFNVNVSNRERFLKDSSPDKLKISVQLYFIRKKKNFSFKKNLFF